MDEYWKLKTESDFDTVPVVRELADLLPELSVLALFWVQSATRS